MFDFLEDIWPFNIGTKKVDIVKTLSPTVLKEHANRALKIYWLELLKYDFKNSFEELITYIDSLTPPLEIESKYRGRIWREIFGSQVVRAEQSLGQKTVYNVMKQVANEGEGLIFEKGADLQVFADIIIGELSNPSLATIWRWTAEGVTKSVSQITAFTKSWGPKIMLVGGILGAAYILHIFKPAIRKVIRK